MADNYSYAPTINDAIRNPEGIEHLTGSDWHAVQHVERMGTCLYIAYKDGGSHTFPASHGATFRRVVAEPRFYLAGSAHRGAEWFNLEGIQAELRAFADVIQHMAPGESVVIKRTQ